MRRRVASERSALWDELPLATVVLAAALCVTLALEVPERAAMHAGSRAPQGPDRGLGPAQRVGTPPLVGDATPSPVRLVRAIEAWEPPSSAAPGEAEPVASGAAAVLGGGPHVGGRPDGPWVHWHPNGEPAAFGTYRAGERVGVWSYAWPGGARRATGRFVRDLPEGPWIEWSPRGRLRRAAHYAAGRLHGAWTEWWANGVVARHGAFEGGQRTGEWTRYDEDGRPVVTGTYRADDRDGVWRELHPDGSLAVESHWLGGVRHGPWSAWYPSGALRAEGRFDHGLRQGRWRFYAPDGRSVRSRSGLYRDGERVDE